MTGGVFVTGTDTGIGKTTCACALISALRTRGVKVAPMKPVAAGDDADTRALMQAAGWAGRNAADVTPVLLAEPMAPHIAAAREGRTIELAPLLAAFERISRDSFAVVEGVGGFRVPLNAHEDSVDLARAFGLPVVLVVGLRLGCLNHALLTVQAIEAARLPLAGWIANQVDPSMTAMEENVEALRERIAAPLLGRVPHRRPPNPASLAAKLDVGPLLRQ